MLAPCRTALQTSKCPELKAKTTPPVMMSPWRRCACANTLQTRLLVTKRLMKPFKSGRTACNAILFCLASVIPWKHQTKSPRLSLARMLRDAEGSADKCQTPSMNRLLNLKTRITNFGLWVITIPNSPSVDTCFAAVFMKMFAVHLAHLGAKMKCLSMYFAPVEQVLWHTLTCAEVFRNQSCIWFTLLCVYLVFSSSTLLLPRWLQMIFGLEVV